MRGAISITTVAVIGIGALLGTAFNYWALLRPELQRLEAAAAAEEEKESKAKLEANSALTGADENALENEEEAPAKLEAVCILTGADENAFEEEEEVLVKNEANCDLTSAEKNAPENEEVAPAKPGANSASMGADENSSKEEKETRAKLEADCALMGADKNTLEEKSSTLGEAPQSPSNERASMAAEQDGSAIKPSLAINTGDEVTKIASQPPSEMDQTPPESTAQSSSNESPVAVTYAPTSTASDAAIRAKAPQQDDSDDEDTRTGHSENSGAAEATSLPAPLADDESDWAGVEERPAKEGKRRRIEPPTARKTLKFKRGSLELDPAVKREIEQHNKLLAMKARLDKAWEHVNEAQKEFNEAWARHTGA